VPKHQIDEERMIELRSAFKRCKGKYEYRRLQCLLLRYEENLKLKEIEQISGYNYKSIGNIIDKYFKFGINSIIGEKRKGGNNRCLSDEQEVQILQHFIKDGESRQMLTLSLLKAAFSDKIGRTITDRTIYGILERHGWQKIDSKSKKPSTIPQEFMRSKIDAENHAVGRFYSVILTCNRSSTIKRFPKPRLAAFPSVKCC
jgi:transposase